MPKLYLDTLFCFHVHDLSLNNTSDCKTHTSGRFQRQRPSQCSSGLALHTQAVAAAGNIATQLDSHLSKCL